MDGAQGIITSNGMEQVFENGRQKPPADSGIRIAIRPTR